MENNETVFVEMRSVDTADSVKPQASEVSGQSEVQLLRQWIQRASEVCEAASRGEFEERMTRLDSDPEIMRLGCAVNSLLDVADAFVREAGAALESAAKKRFYRKLVVRGLRGAFQRGAMLINSAAGEMEHQEGRLATQEKRRLSLADGFEGAIQHVVASLASSAAEMQATATSLSGVAATTSQTACAVASAAEESSVTSQTVAAATEHLTRAVANVGTQIESSSKLVGSAISAADHTREVMASLAGASKRIGGVINLISKIAGQTNLLALNASIEAARAGESGKGFAVVASEVKNLSRQTEQATSGISQEIDAIQKTCDQAVQAVDDVGAIIKELGAISSTISSAVDTQLATAGEISESVRQVADAAGHTSSNITSVTRSSRETESAVTDLLGAANELSRQAETLRHSVDSFLVEIRASGE